MLALTSVFSFIHALSSLTLSGANLSLSSTQSTSVYPKPLHSLSPLLGTRLFTMSSVVISHSVSAQLSFLLASVSGIFLGPSLPRLVTQTDWPASPPASAVLGFQALMAMTGFSSWTLGIELGPHAYAPNA